MTNIRGYESLPNIPWQDKEVGCEKVVWRNKNNPIITRDNVKNANSIFNSAVISYNGAFIGVFRVDDDRRNMVLHVGRSKNAIDWDIEDTPIKFICEDEDVSNFEYGYDPRLCKIDDKYYVTWCNGYYGPTIGIAYTYDFKEFHKLENAFLPYNRNGVMFPRKINGNYAMLSRPSDTSHTPFGDIFYSESPDMTYWGKHRFVMKPTKMGWQATKVGAGPIPIETDEGWLLIYHGVLTSCNGLTYSMGAAILDLEKPWKVKYRADRFLLAPHTAYECMGDVPNVVFPCAALVDPDTDKLTIYYGAADTTVCMAHTYVSDVIKFVKENNIATY